ncbi:MAG: 50S ribosomal protein L3 [Candidatus Colwellbacteria bacterium]|nr:50S ribosomal protein L3 [Candidatus Colwellbacteria bacterium]
MNYLKARKMKMQQIFEDEKSVPVTFVEIIKKDEVQDFKVGDLFKVSGTSKSKGFQGVVKRHGFHGGPKTHGQKNRHRAPGSIGATAPQRVIPGVKMAGRMGGKKVTLKKLRVVAIQADKSILALKGAIPGRKGGELKLYPVTVSK